MRNAGKGVGCKVLVVEDEFLVALQLEDILTDGGHTVVGTVADMDSLANLAEPPEIAFVDLNLRDGLTGPEIARLLAERYATLVIYATANPCQIDEPAHTSVGVLRKPFCDRSVLEAVEFASTGPDALQRPTSLEALPAIVT